MIQVNQINNGKAATRYYAGTASGVVQLEDRGVWGGKGAKRLELFGEVDRGGFLAMSTNVNPMTGLTLTARMKKNRRSGYDMCFDVPKSVSIYLAETKDKLVERLIQEVFRETMTEIEKSMMTREYASDERRATGNIVYASFVHRLSRPVKGQIDPQHHIHAFVFNATYDEVEQRWKAGEFGPIVTQMPSFERMFNDKLMNKFNAIGIRIRRTARAFELDGITRGLIEKFSKRWQQVGQQAKRLNRKMLNAIRERKPKVKMDEDELRRDWRSQMTDTERQSIHDTRRHSIIHRSVMFERMIPNLYANSVKEQFVGRATGRIVTPTVRTQDRSMGVEKRMDIQGMDR